MIIDNCNYLLLFGAHYRLAPKNTTRSVYFAFPQCLDYNKKTNEPFRQIKSSLLHRCNGDNVVCNVLAKWPAFVSIASLFVLDLKGGANLHTSQMWGLLSLMGGTAASKALTHGVCYNLSITEQTKAFTPPTDLAPFFKAWWGVIT